MLALSRNTMRRLEALFPPATREEAARLLIHECGTNLPFREDDTPTSAERIRYAALKLSAGNLDELRRAVEIAKEDWRDVLVAAGFGADVTAHLLWDPTLEGPGDPA